MILTSVSRTTIILSVPGIKHERTVIASQSRKGVARVLVETKKIQEAPEENPRETLRLNKMNHEMIVTFQLALCLIPTFYGEISMGKPLTPEDVEGLLPPTPQDKNETIAAVVQDPVVQDAVHHAASNGSLNGLVVKKNIFIMPATNPNLVLSKREHILVVPTENLEDVRKNITEAKEAEARETSTLENQAFFEDDASEYATEGHENGSDGNETEENKKAEEAISSSEKRKSETEFLKDKIIHDATIPEDTSASKKVAVPIVAVIDPSNANKGKVNSPIVAILPNQVNNGALNSQVQFLKDNSDKIQKKAQDYVDKSSLTVNPDYWTSSTPPELAVVSSPTQGIVPASLFTDHENPSYTEEMFLTPVMVSQFDVYAPSLTDNDRTDYTRETGDMDVAEDVIFRPLFRYRQETQQRSRYNDENNRRYGSYGDYYPRRAYFYRPRYDDY
ncbi:hypothetical protein ANTPLA_LOCUS3538 [Anthophora plagiata]